MTHTMAIPGPAPLDPAPSLLWPAWLQEFDSTLAVHSQFVFSGNVRDLYAVAGRPNLASLRHLLWEVLRRYGFAGVIVYDSVDGFSIGPVDGPEGDVAATAAARLLGPHLGKRVPPGELRDVLDDVLSARTDRFAVVVDYASRLARRPDSLSDAERDFFLHCLKRSAGSMRRSDGLSVIPHNPLIWLADSDGDLPAWLGTGNPQVRGIVVPTPVLGTRRIAAELLTARMRVRTDPGQAEEVIKAFARETSGLTLREMRATTELAEQRGLPFERLPEAVVTYRLGVSENPWLQPYLRTQIKREEAFVQRVMGQPKAVRRVLDVLKRASLGMSGAHTGRPGRRPRGVLFFAGPTGVGKTELAKAVAQVVNGDEAALLRFDMSEFAEPHAADRLIGAPPGYTGHESGGQLTNAMRLQPFRVILFDEIEKAHPLVLDKFLQILEDGRLTDGLGRTVYFSETMIIFTSNLGVLHEDTATGQVTMLVHPHQPFDEVETSVRRKIEAHFKTKIKRPELLNRIGDNIVVFDFIRSPADARIFDQQVDNVLHLLRREHGIDIDLSPVHDLLRARCTEDLHYGGRGIGNQVEAHLVNPLARALFDLAERPAGPLLVTAADFSGELTTLTLSPAWQVSHG
jgi:hypothetical protein